MQWWTNDLYYWDVKECWILSPFALRQLLVMMITYYQVFVFALDSLSANQTSPAILVKNLETLVSISPSPMLIWVSQWSECFKIGVAQHWGGRRHISGGKTVWSRNLMIVPENSRETVSVSTICDEYCLCVWRACTGNVNVARVIIVPCGGYVRSVLVLTFLDMK